MSASLGLYRLQQVDSQVDQIQARLKTIQETLENNVELVAAAQALATADSNHKDSERALKQSENEVETQRIKIEQTEAKLYSGNVHNPKELQDLQMDTASLKRHLETLEERQLETMVIAEATENELQAAKEKLESVKANLKVQNHDLTLESETLNKDYERLQSERNAVMSDIPGQFVSTYDQLRTQKRGIAVTMISDGSCSSCGTALTLSLQQNARSASQLFNCTTCGRILYAN